MKNKIYCKTCKYYQYETIGSDICSNPKLMWIDISDTYKELITTKKFSYCEIENKNNDCKYFAPKENKEIQNKKWWKFW